MSVVYSKLLCEYKVVSGANDKLKIDDGTEYTITLTAGRYRDVIALASEIQTQLNASASSVTFTVTVNSTTGLVAIAGDASWTLDWDTSTYGTTLRDDLGFTGSETPSSNTYTATSQPVGSFYPSEPVEADDRPSDTASDRWDSDTMQQEGRTGVIATKGGTVAYYRRSIQLLLPQDDLSAFVGFLARAREGYSFAFYHDRTEDWDGPDDEYEQYKLRAEGEAGISYDPERVDPANTIWHRATLALAKYVAPTV